MVKHIVLWKIKDSADKQQNIDRMIEMLTSLVGKIDGLVSVEMGHNFNPSSEFDVVLYATLKNPSALEHYQNHPEHVACKEFIGNISESRACVDYFYEESDVSFRPFDEVPDAPEEKPETEITVTFPEKRVLEETPYFKTLVRREEKPKKEKQEAPAAKRDYVPKIPVITVTRPPLWEPEVFEPPVETAPVEAKPVEAAPVEAAPVESKPVEAAPVESKPVEAAPIEAAPVEAKPVEAAPVEEPYIEPPASKPIPVEVSAVYPASKRIWTTNPDVQRPTPRSAPAPKAAPTPTPRATPVNAQVNPVSTEHSKVVEKTNAFGKKKIDVEVTPLDQRSDTWTCPNCGKIMPNYVGTCGCGETKPFDFGDEPAPAPASKIAPASKTAPAPKAAPAPRPAPTPRATPANAQVNPVSTEHSKVVEKTNAFGKKKIDVEVTPLDQRSDTWTCPNCGKIMPNYVGTCGCGETKPFDFGDEPAPAPAPKSAPAPKAAPAPRPAPTPRATPANAQVNPVSTEHSKVVEKTNAFGKKKIDVEVIPLDQRSDTWTCPNCGKIMPNYVGTCGCGETKPFDFGFDSAPAKEEALPDIMPSTPPKNKMSPEQVNEINKTAPSIQSYNPQLNKDIPTAQGNQYSYIQNDRIGKTDPNYKAPDLSYINNKNNGFNNGATNNIGGNQNLDDPIDPFDFSNDIPAAPMRFSDFGGGNNDPKPYKPPEYKRPPVDDFASVNPSKKTKDDKKRAFGKKAKEEEAFRKAQEAVQNRKDVPNSGTWTCPNCGKVMPDYVGTCGCGETKPFEF